MSFEKFLRENPSISGFVLHTWIKPDEVRFYIATKEGNTLKFVAKGDKVTESD